MGTCCRWNSSSAPSCPGSCRPACRSRDQRCHRLTYRYLYQETKIDKKDWVKFFAHNTGCMLPVLLRPVQRYVPGSFSPEPEYRASCPIPSPLCVDSVETNS